MSGKVKCDERRCGWQGMAHEVLKATHPFITGGQIEGCPKCRQCGTIIPVCDEQGCWNHASCGTPTPAGYRSTCPNHIPEIEK